jgi:hypothetical protein
VIGGSTAMQMKHLNDIELNEDESVASEQTLVSPAALD